MKTSRRPLWLLVLGALVLLFIVISLGAWLLETNPPVVQEPNWDSPQTRALAQRACFDCHSNQTTWPWFARVPPGSWLAALDTVRGRRHLNFSEWNANVGSGVRGEGREGGNPREIARVIQDGSMPPATYLMLHPNARLNSTEQQALIQGLQASLR